MKKAFFPMLGWISLALLLWTAAASDAGSLPLWQLAAQCLLGVGGLAACRLTPYLRRRRARRPAPVYRLDPTPQRTARIRS